MNTVTDYGQYLKRGEENAIPSQELATAAGFSNIRKLREDIARSREAGQIIISSTQGGYYLPADKADIIGFIESMESRAKKIMLAIRSAKKAVNDIDGQIHIEDLL